MLLPDLTRHLPVPWETRRTGWKPPSSVRNHRWGQICCSKQSFYNRMTCNSRWVLLTFFPESDRKSIDAIANKYRLRNRDLVLILSLDGSPLHYKQLAKNKCFKFYGDSQCPVFFRDWGSELFCVFSWSQMLKYCLDVIGLTNSRSDILAPFKSVAKFLLSSAGAKISSSDSADGKSNEWSSEK